MPLTIAQIGADCLTHLRLASNTASDAQLAYLANTINRALEEMRVASPAAFRATADVTWTGGQAFTAGAVHGSAALTAGGIAIARGSSIQLTGDSTFNEVVTGAASPYGLLFPYAGSTGNVAATAWGDSVVLDTTVDRVLGGMLLHERRPLIVASNRGDWQLHQGAGFHRDYGTRNMDVPAIRLPGVPRAVWVETVLTANVIEYRARCAPLPNGTFRATLEVQTMPDAITADDLAVIATTVRPVPGQRVFGILRALCLYHWTGSPWFRNEAARAVILADYQNAVGQLTGFRPNAAEAVRMAVTY